MRKLTQADCSVSRWSGGTTTQLAIFPPQAAYADRSFLWRVSSAAVETEASDFTALPEYDRLIAPLRGQIILTHNGGASVLLRPYEVHAFSGADLTHCLGRCTDFNLMLRRGAATGSMEALRPAEAPVSFTLAAEEQALLYCAEGACAIRAGEQTVFLTAGESLLQESPGELVLRAEGSAVVMACRMRLTERTAEEGGPSVGKKIYFAGSIRGGRVDAALYRRMIDYMKRRHTVLTEHVGDLSLSVLERGRGRDTAIYDQDTAWLRQSDVLVAECTCPSLGVGYELAYAEHRGIPCHIFYDPEKTQLSAMLTGDPYFHVHPYTREEEIFPILDGILNED